MTIIASLSREEEAFWQAFQQGFAETAGTYVGDVAGYILGTLLALLIYLLAVYFAWGFIWDRILTKAGFEGKPFWIIFALMVVPALMLPIVVWLPNDILETFVGIQVFCQWSGMMSIVLLPWPVRKAAKRAKPKAAISAKRA